MPKVIEAYEAEGAEAAKLLHVTRMMLRLMDEAELTSADAMNVLSNLTAEIAIIACISREDYMSALTQTYDMHIEHHSKNETLN